MWQGFKLWWLSRGLRANDACENYSYSISQWVLTRGNVKLVVTQSNKKAKKPQQSVGFEMTRPCSSLRGCRPNARLRRGESEGRDAREAKALAGKERFYESEVR